MLQRFTRKPRRLLACMLALTTQAWPRAALTLPQGPAPAEPVAMLPAEQHMGEFSDGDLAFIRQAAVLNEAMGIYAKLALRRAKGGDVREVAHKLATYHRKARTDLANVVQPYGVVLPAGIDAAHQWLRARLMEADAKAFDRMYVKSQIDEHATAVRALREQLAHGKSAGLRAWARGVLAGMEEHRRTLEALSIPKPVS